MKILWFAATPCGSVRRTNTKTLAGGWLISLEDELKKNKSVELHVSFLSTIEENSFEYDNVKYYPVKVKHASSPILRIIDRFHNDSSIEKEVLPKLEAIVSKVKPDIIHIHGTEGVMGICSDYVENIPVVFSIQGLIAPYSEKFFSGLPQTFAYKNDPIYDVMRNVGIKRAYQGFLYKAQREKGYLQKANYVFGRTQWDKDVTGLFNPNRKYYVVDEILRNQFYKTHWQKDGFNKKLKIVSTISGGIYKGYETVLKSAKLLIDYADFDFEWHIAGYDMKSKWVHLAEKLTGIKTSACNITLHGRIDADELSALLTESDIYVHVSHIENSPNSVCEAMLIGMPVIASFAGGTSSMLENEKEGILVQDGDPYMYAGAIIDYYMDFDKAKIYGENARRRAMERHNPEQIANQLVAAYNAILNDFDTKSSKNSKFIHTS